MLRRDEDWQFHVLDPPRLRIDLDAVRGLPARAHKMRWYPAALDLKVDKAFPTVETVLRRPLYCPVKGWARLLDNLSRLKRRT